MSTRDLVFLIVGVWVGAGLMAALITWMAPEPERRSVPPRAAQGPVVIGSPLRHTEPDVRDESSASGCLYSSEARIVRRLPIDRRNHRRTV